MTVDKEILAWAKQVNSGKPAKKKATKKKRGKGGNHGKNAAKREKLRQSRKEFYMSHEWRKLRAKALEHYGCKCMMCGRSPQTHKVILHVDHIKPRSKHPELSLEFSNLQILCEDCNLGKSNRYDTDWRPKDLDIEESIATYEEEYNILLDALELIAHYHKNESSEVASRAIRKAKNLKEL